MFVRPITVSLNIVGYFNGGEGYYSHLLWGYFPNKYANKIVYAFDLRDNLEPARNYTGLYSTHVFTQKAIDVIDYHAAHQSNKVTAYLAKDQVISNLIFTKLSLRDHIMIRSHLGQVTYRQGHIWARPHLG